MSESWFGRLRIHRLETAPLSEVQQRLPPYGLYWRDRLRSLGELLDRIPDDDA
ncbi:hypothetical protein [Streptomyces adustus]|uniref:hypothetical protein n=1 Tax=Streptomyces adustus TaxID=1609272 RepID=UPI0012E0A815|nr:hypothetical protein [Streptomyces adustus]